MARMDSMRDSVADVSGDGEGRSQGDGQSWSSVLLMPRDMTYRNCQVCEFMIPFHPILVLATPRFSDAFRICYGVKTEPDPDCQS